MLLQVLISCRLMEENTQRDHGSKAQEWGSKESKERAKKGGNGQFGAPGRHLGAITERRRPSGARGRHLGADSAANFSFREIRVFTPYISFLTPPNLLPSSPRSKIPSSLRVFIIFSQSPLKSTSFHSKSLIIPLFYYHFHSISTTHLLQPPSSSMAAPLDEFGLSSTMSG